MVSQELQEHQGFLALTGKMEIRGTKEYEDLWDPAVREDYQDQEDGLERMVDMVMQALQVSVLGRLLEPVLKRRG